MLYISGNALLSNACGFFFFFSRMGGIWFKHFSKPRMVASGWAISKIFLSNTYVISRSDPQHLDTNNGKDTKSESEQKSPDHHLLQLPTEIPPNSQSSVYYNSPLQHSSPPACQQRRNQGVHPVGFSLGIFFNIIVQRQ